MDPLLDDIDAKTKFVKSITKKTTTSTSQDIRDDFLKPIKTTKVVRLTIVENPNAPNDESSGKGKSRELDEYVHLLNVVRPKGYESYVETSDVPEWAKLALSSSNPNKRKIDYY